MNCDETARSVPLYFYGELPPEPGNETKYPYVRHY